MQHKNHSGVIMPKATAVWLVENTSLTFAQIAEFCSMHELEVKAIADNESAQGIAGVDPVNVTMQLAEEEIARCTADPTAFLNKRVSTALSELNKSSKLKKSSKKYIPRARRKDRPDAILWLIKNYPNMAERSIVKLLGTTKNTVQAIKNKTYWNLSELRATNPVILGLCNQSELEQATKVLDLDSKAQNN